MSEKKKPPIPLEDAYSEAQEKAAIEKSFCKYKANRKVNAFKRYPEPVCACGCSHSKVKDTFKACFVLPADVEKFKALGYALWTDAETGAQHTYAGQVMMIISKETALKRDMEKRKKLLSGIAGLKEELSEVAGSSSLVMGGNPHMSYRDVSKEEF